MQASCACRLVREVVIDDDKGADLTPRKGIRTRRDTSELYVGLLKDECPRLFVVVAALAST